MRIGVERAGSRRAGIAWTTTSRLLGGRDALHQDLAIGGLILAGIHGGLLALDHTMPFSPLQIAVPFLAPYLPLWVGVGQVAFYLTAVVELSFYVRRHIGQRAWRLLHYLTFLAFLGAAAHGLLAGTDSGARWAWWLYVGTSASVAFLLTYRIVVAAGSRARRDLAADRGRRSGGATRLVVPVEVEIGA